MKKRSLLEQIKHNPLFPRSHPALCLFRFRDFDKPAREGESFCVLNTFSKEMNARGDLLKWFKARNRFFGLSCVRQGLREGLALARESAHEDAKWLCGLFRDGAPESREQAWLVLSRQPQDNARAVCFAGLLRRSKSGLERAANMGNVLARAILGVSSSKQWFSGDSACQNDPNYMMAVVKYLHNEHRVKAIKLAKVAAEWENPEAQEYYGTNGFKLSDAQKYYWYEKAARNGNENAARIAIQDIPYQLRHYDKFGSGRIIFQIGEELMSLFATRL